MTFRHHILPAALTLLLAFFLYSVMKPQPGALLLRATQIYVIDGDTIRTHGNVMVRDNPRRLELTIVDGKTGYRATTTMEAAVSVYERVCARNPDAVRSDYLFFPSYQNRTTVRDIVKRQFKELLKRADLLVDPITGKNLEMYSLRHTAICMRIINGGGKVDIFNLAKNAGTSVDQIERFYAKYLPPAAELARNLQTFSE